MNPMQGTPLTVTELETLATILNSAINHMAVTGKPAAYAWPKATLSQAVEDLCMGFYDIASTAVRAGGDDSLYTVIL